MVQCRDLVGFFVAKLDDLLMIRHWLYWWFRGRFHPGRRKNNNRGAGTRDWGGRDEEANGKKSNEWSTGEKSNEEANGETCDKKKDNSEESYKWINGDKWDQWSNREKGGKCSSQCSSHSTGEKSDEEAKWKISDKKDNGEKSYKWSNGEKWDQWTNGQKGGNFSLSLKLLKWSFQVKEESQGRENGTDYSDHGSEEVGKMTRSLARMLKVVYNLYKAGLYGEMMEPLTSVSRVVSNLMEFSMKHQ